MSLEQLVSQLQHRGGFELVNHSSGKNQLRLLGRVPREAMGPWLVLLQHLLVLEKGRPWSLDVSKSYFLRSSQIVFAWRILIQAEDVEQYFASIAQAVLSAPRAKVIIEQQPLVGVSASRNTLTRGKGAQGVLTASVGPLAAADMARR